MKEMKEFDKIDWALFGVAVFVALAFSSWSMFHLATDIYTIPFILALVISLMFDVGGLFLGRLSDKYAVNGDKNSFVTWATRGFIVTAVFLNVAHAALLGWGIVGMVLLGSASLIAGILFHVFLHYRSVQAKRKAGTYIESLPTAGFLAMVRYFKPWWAMKSLGLKTRILEATDKITGTPSTPINVGPAIVGEPVKKEIKPTQKILAPAMSDESPKPSFAEVKVEDPFKPPMGFRAEVPDYLNDVKPNASAITKACVENGLTDAYQIQTFAKDIIGKDIQVVNVQKYVSKWSSK